MGITDYVDLNFSGLPEGIGENPHGEEPTIDTSEEMRKKTRKLLDVGEDYWYNMEGFRSRRARSRNYFRGLQWEDQVDDPDDPSKKIKEKDLIEANGKIAMINNQIRQVVKNLIGQYRMNDFDPMVKSRKRENQSASEMLTNTLHYLYDINGLTEKDVRLFEEFLISGAPINKVGFRHNPNLNREETFIERVHPNRIAFNSDIEDQFGEDVSFIVQLHDMEIEDIIATFAKNKGDEEELLKSYGPEVYNEAYFESEFDSSKVDEIDFYVPHDYSRGRVFEVWRKELKEKLICHDWAKAEHYQHPMEVDQAAMDVYQDNISRINEFRKIGQIPPEVSDEQFMQIHDELPNEQKFLIEASLKNERVWVYYYISYKGDLLQTGESPFDHESHPYVMALYPMVDGEVWGFVEDIIDQQRHINRWISLIDSIVGQSAKGVLMVPESIIPDNMDPDEFAKQWVRHDGMIIYKPDKSGAMPKHIANNSLPAGAIELLQLEMSLLKEISGVSDAIQGGEAKAGTPASLYAQMSTNSTISSRDYFEFFKAFIKKRDLRIIQVTQQFYDEPRYINIAGQDYDESASVFDPDKAGDLEVDIVMGESAQSPVFRELSEQNLMMFWQSGEIDFNTYLEMSSLPQADKLQQKIKEKEAQLKSQGVDPSQVPSVQGGGGAALAA